jgi:hypothetical protein
MLHEELAAELNRGFVDGSGPVARVTLFHGEKRSVLLFAVHHSPFDGKSTLLTPQDLLPSMTGELIGESKEALLTNPPRTSQ